MHTLNTKYTGRTSTNHVRQENHATKIWRKARPVFGERRPGFQLTSVAIEERQVHGHGRQARVNGAANLAIDIKDMFTTPFVLSGLG